MLTIKWLEKWYEEVCDGNWEHLYGVTITTLDNPGWFVQINLDGTRYSGMKMDEIKHEKGPNDWFICSIRDNTFQGAGDALKLEKIIYMFRRCVEKQEALTEI